MPIVNSEDDNDSEDDEDDNDSEVADHSETQRGAPYSCDNNIISLGDLPIRCVSLA